MFAVSGSGCLLAAYAVYKVIYLHDNRYSTTIKVALHGCTTHCLDIGISKLLFYTLNMLKTAERFYSGTIQFGKCL